MCIKQWFGGGNKAAAALAAQQNADAAASLAAANLDSESSRTAAEQRMRKIAGMKGLASTVLMRGGEGAGPAVRQLTGQ